MDKTGSSSEKIEFTHCPIAGLKPISPQNVAVRLFLQMFEANVTSETVLTC